MGRAGALTLRAAGRRVFPCPRERRGPECCRRAATRRRSRMHAGPHFCPRHGPDPGRSWVGPRRHARRLQAGW